ncbi:HD-GYP domain-containing protein [Flexivirga oryzae]|nr:HD domain-containing phosphohydrolase [Flexivirga oryzae]
MVTPLVLAQWSYAQQHAESVAHERTVSSLVAAVDARDPIMRGRNVRVANVSEAIGNELRLSPAQADALHFAALLHDVGMVAPVKGRHAGADMRQADLERIRRHPTRGVEMLRSIEFLGDSITAIRHHHERWDGRGYPDRLAGSAIPLLARVLAVADAFCALVPRIGAEAAVETLRRRSGEQFDPACVAAVCELAESVAPLAQVDHELADQAGEPGLMESRWLDHDLPDVSDLLAAESAPR